MLPALETNTTAEPAHKRDLLRRFLQTYWLRPENALWMTLRSLTLRQASFSAPSVDLSCGDGAFSFLHFGGRFCESFDVFSSTGNLDKVTREHADMFDHVDDDYHPAIESRPRQSVSIGTDWKPALLTKASRLGLYEQLFLHDNNRPLPWDDQSLATIYSNSIYWVENLEQLLREIRRVLAPNGTLILQVKLDTMKQFSLERWEKNLGETFVSIIGRGRFDTWPNLLSRSQWEEQFAQAGFAIRNASPFVTGTHARLWDVGLRPIAPLLVKMANALESATRSEIKHDWVDLWMELLAPLCDCEFDGLGTGEPVEIQYELSPTT